MFMTPTQVHRLVGPNKLPVRRPVTSLPVKRGRFVQKGQGCGNQRGGNIFDSIASGFEEAFSDPMRGIAAVATGGISEAVIQSGQAFEKTTGVKPSNAIDIALIPASLFVPEIAIPGAAVSAGYKMIGMGNRSVKMKKGKKGRKVKKGKKGKK
jgi:hypothetical protein